jgi:hypothetical protein
MEDLEEHLLPCDENTLRVVLVELCAVFQRDYLNVPKLHEGKLSFDHVKEIVRNALNPSRSRSWVSALRFGGRDFLNGCCAQSFSRSAPR